MNKTEQNVIHFFNMHNKTLVIYDDVTGLQC